MRTYKLVAFLIVLLLASCAPTMKDLPKLQEKAQSLDEKSRISAIESIGKIKDAESTVLPILYNALGSDTSPAVREHAAKSLMNLGFGEASTALVAALKKDSDPAVRRASAEALYSLSGNEAIDVLVDCSGKDNSASVRAVCVKFIGKIGGPKASAEVRKRLKDDPAPEVRAQAATALGEMKVEQSYELLKEAALKDQAKVVREAAVIAIGNIPGKDSMQFLCGALKMANLQDAAITSIHVNRRGGESQEAITQLLNIAGSSSKPDQRILNIFLTSRDARVKPYFRRVILYEYASSDSIEAIASNLRKAGDTSMVPQLINDLRSEQKFPVQVNLCRALGHFRDPRAVPQLLTMLRNRSQYHNCLPKHLVWALEVIRDPRAFQYLCEMCCNEADKDLRYDACMASSEIWRSHRDKVRECPCWNK